MPVALANHDIVVTSTAATLPVITTEQVRQARRGKLNSLVFIDLAVPRDVEAGVGDLNDVYRYDLDHLDKMVASNSDLRKEDITDVENLIGEHRDQFAKKIAIAQNPLPAIMNQWFTKLVDDEFNRLERKSDSGRCTKRGSTLRLAPACRQTPPSQPQLASGRPKRS